MMFPVQTAVPENFDIYTPAYGAMVRLELVMVQWLMLLLLLEAVLLQSPKKITPPVEAEIPLRVALVITLSDAPA